MGSSNFYFFPSQDNLDFGDRVFLAFCWDGRGFVVLGLLWQHQALPLPPSQPLKTCPTGNYSPTMPATAYLPVCVSVFSLSFLLPPFPPPPLPHLPVLGSAMAWLIFPVCGQPCLYFSMLQHSFCPSAFLSCRQTLFLSQFRTFYLVPCVFLFCLVPEHVLFSPLHFLPITYLYFIVLCRRTWAGREVPAWPGDVLSVLL